MKKSIRVVILRRSSNRSYKKYRIVEVTTEKRRQVYGRYLCATATHFGYGEILASFSSVSDAEKAFDTISMIEDHYASKRRLLDKQLTEIYNAEKQDLERAVSLMGTEL